MLSVTLLLAGLTLAAAIGFYEAHAKNRGAEGWIDGFVASVMGGIPAGAILPMLAIAMLNPGREGAQLVGIASVIVGAVLGTGIVLRIVHSVR